MNDGDFPVKAAIFGLVGAALLGFAIGVLPAPKLPLPDPPQPAIVDVTPAPDPQPPTTLTPGEQLLDGAGTAAGEVWAEITSPDAKQGYSDAWDDVKSGAGRVADSFNETVDEQRQRQQQSP